MQQLFKFTLEPIETKNIDFNSITMKDVDELIHAMKRMKIPINLCINNASAHDIYSELYGRFLTEINRKLKIVQRNLI